MSVVSAQVQGVDKMLAVLENALEQYNESNAVMDLVLFEDAMRHVSRISRIIESPGGHALLVGVGGMGKQSLSKLATYVNQFAVFQIVISATYGARLRVSIRRPLEHATPCLSLLACLLHADPDPSPDRHPSPQGWRGAPTSPRSAGSSSCSPRYAQARARTPD